MKLLRRLEVRLLLSYLAVTVVTLAVMAVALQVLVPSEFEAEVERIGQQHGLSRETVPNSVAEQPGSVDDPDTPTMPPSSTVGSSTPGDGDSASTTTPGSAPGGPGTTSGPGTTGGTGESGTTGGSVGSARTPGSGAALTNPIEAAQQGPRGPAGSSDTTTVVVDLEAALDKALDAGLWVAFVVSFVLATILAAVTSRRVLKPLRNVQLATRRLAEGRYGERVPIPNEIELAELAADVNALGETLERTEQQRSRLMSDLAHELRTPLTTIQGYMEGLIDGVFEPTPEVFTEVADEATRLKRLTADLALLSRAEEGALILDLHTVDLGRVACRAAERLRPQFHDQDVVLSLGPMPDLPVRGDPDRLAQAFTNLVGNALIHTPAGGRVWLNATADASTCAVSVHDTGEGIPANELEQIFERFHRVEGRGVAFTGSGIGLTISRTIIRSHGGELSVDSAGPGRGSTFTVRVPRANP